MRELQVFQDENFGVYRAYAAKPSDVTQQMFDGRFYRTHQKEMPDGSINMTQAFVCEDCWKEIPKYLDFPRGLTSPESDGDAGGNYQKHRKVWIQGANGMLEATEALQKTVCRECYIEAFKRTYPGKRLPVLSPEVYQVKDEAKIEQPVTEMEFVPAPKEI